MTKEYIERDAFIAEQRHLYCENCERRKGMKSGKTKFVYAIGEAPCRACDIGDVLDDVEDYPAADVAPVRHGRWKPHSNVETPVFHCSVCGGAALHAFGKQCKSDYCPSCGAVMDGGSDDGQT